MAWKVLIITQLSLIDFRYKEFTSIVTAIAVAPTQRERSIVWLFTLIVCNCMLVCLYCNVYSSLLIKRNTESHTLITVQHTNTTLSINGTPSSLEVNRLCSTFKSILLTNNTNYAFDMTMYICNMPCLINLYSRKLVKAGIDTWGQNIPTVSSISNPQSAEIVSPGIKLFNGPQFSVRCLSLTLPPQPSG